MSLNGEVGGGVRRVRLWKQTGGTIVFVFDQHCAHCVDRVHKDLRKAQAKRLSASEWSGRESLSVNCVSGSEVDVEGRESSEGKEDRERGVQTTLTQNACVI